MPFRCAARTAGFVALIALPFSFASPSTAASKSYAYAYDQGARDRFGWAIVSGGTTDTSDLESLGSLDPLKARFGDDFLYIYENRDSYVILDPELIARAHEASARIARYGKKIGEYARARANAALSEARSDDSRDRRELAAEQEEAQRNLRQAVRDMKREMRKILRDAKSMHAVQRIG